MKKGKGSQKRLKVLVASMLGISMMFCVPHVPTTIGAIKDSVVQTVKQENQAKLEEQVKAKALQEKVLAQSKKRAAQTIATETKVGATTTEVTGNTTETAVNAGLKTDASRDKVGLTDESALPTAVTGNWLDDFLYVDKNPANKETNNLRNLDSLLQLTEGEGNFISRGYQDNTYEIRNEKEFAFFSAAIQLKGNNANNSATFNNKTFKLTADIDLKDHAWTPIFNIDFWQTGWTMNFDGNGRTIKNAYIKVSESTSTEEQTAAKNTSIFGNWCNGKISNLTIENANISSYKSAAIVAYSDRIDGKSVEFEDITVKNSRVVAGVTAMGISEHAKSFVNCTLENSEVLVSDTDTTLFNAETIENALDKTATYTVYGLGRAQKVDVKDTGTVGLKNSKVGFESKADQFKGLTGLNRTRTINIYGVARWYNAQGSESGLKNITIENSDVYSNIEIKDAKEKATLQSGYYMSYGNSNVNLYGAVQYTGDASTTIELSKIKVENSKIYSEYKYNPSDDEKNGSLIFNNTNYIFGVASTDSSNSARDAITYRDIQVINSEIYANSNTNVVKYDSNGRPSGYDTWNLNNFISGVGRNSSRNLDNTLFDTITLKDSKVNGKVIYKCVDDADYSIYTRNEVMGVARWEDLCDAHFRDVTVTNCEISADSDADAGTSNGEKDYNNPATINGWVAGVGRGTFENVKVEKSKIVSNMKHANDRNADVDKNSYTGSSQAMGIGCFAGLSRSENSQVYLENCDVTATATANLYALTTMLRSNAAKDGVGLTQSHVKDCNMTATTTKASSYVAGLLFSDHYQNSGETKTIDISNCEVNNLKIVSTTDRASIVTAGVYSSYAVDEGITLQENTFTKIKYERNETAEGDSRFAVALHNTGSSQVNLHKNNVSDVIVKYDITSGTTARQVSHLTGLAFITATKTAGNVDKVYDNVVSNISLENKITGTANLGHYIETTGLVYNSSSALIEYKNNTVKDSTLKSETNCAEAYTSGMGIQTTDRRSTYDECYAYNNDVSTTFLSGGTNAAATIASYGLNGGYAKTITNSVVGSGKVHATNAIGTATAAGIGYTRGMASESNPRLSENEADIYNAEIKGCVNFAEVYASTESTSITYASGIGRAEDIEDCANYGNVTGNRAGGITTGVVQSGNNQTEKRWSLPLILRNNLNAGNICRPTGGSTSYLGGIIGIYQMGYTADFKFVLENNVSIGGVYSRFENGEYSQNLSTGTYLGMLYGYFYLQSYTGTYDDISIRNNYMYVEKEGFNEGLYRENDVEGVEGLKGTINTPAPNYITTMEGVFGSGNLDKNKEILNAFKTHSTNIESKTVTNTYFGSDYSETTFNRDAEYASYATQNGWKEWHITSGNIPTIETTRQRLLVVYSLGDHDGTVPNVQIIEKNQENKFVFNAADKDIDGKNIITQVGVSVSKWADPKDTSYDPNAQVTKETAGIVYFTAEVDWTQYKIEIETEDKVTVKYEIGGANQSGTFNIALNTENAVLKSEYSDSNLNAIDWQVKQKDAETWDLIKTETVVEHAQETTLKISDFINSEFLSKYATQDNTIKIKAHAVTATLFAITKNDVESEGAGHYKLTATYGSGVGTDALANSVPEGSKVTIKVEVDPYYTLESLTNAEGGDQITGSGDTYEIASLTKATTINVTVKKIKYKVNVQIQNLQGVTLDSSLTDTLFDSLSEQTVSVDSNLPQIQAKTNIPGYRFVGFKLVGMDDYIADTNGKIDDGYTISNEDFGKYITGRDESARFNIIAVYQRQYRVNVTLNNEFDESFASEYELIYTDENGEEQHLTNVQGAEDERTVLSSGSYMIDENTFIQLKIKPNKRVSTIAPQGEQFGNNTVYIYLTGDKNITIDFAIRDINLNLAAVNVLKPDDDEDDRTSTQAYQLVSAITYSIQSETGDELGDEESTQTVAVNNKITFNYNQDTLKNALYRFIALRLWNVKTSSYDDIELGQQITLGNDFFDKYVNDDGQIVVSMKIIKQFTATITGENLESGAYTLGDYSVQILDEEGSAADSERYTVKTDKESYVLDNGLKLVITPEVKNKYATFDGFVGLFDGEDDQPNKAEVSISDNRSISVRFEKTTFTMDLSYNAGVGGTLEYTKTFQLGDTISISYSPKSNYQIKEWKINGKSLAQIGATQNGNTISFVATEDVLDALFGTGLVDDTLEVNTNISTAMSPIILYGIIGAGALIVILTGVVTVLVLRSRKLKKQKEENEKKLNAIARKVNIADMIKDLTK